MKPNTTLHLTNAECNWILSALLFHAYALRYLVKDTRRATELQDLVDGIKNQMNK